MPRKNKRPPHSPEFSGLFKLCARPFGTHARARTFIFLFSIAFNLKPLFNLVFSAQSSGCEFKKIAISLIFWLILRFFAPFSLSTPTFFHLVFNHLRFATPTINYTPSIFLTSNERANFLGELSNLSTSSGNHLLNVFLLK